MPSVKGVDIGRRYATSWFNQCSVLWLRTFKLKYRDPIDGSAWLAGTVYTECSDLQGICEENYPNATWCSGAK